MSSRHDKDHPFEAGLPEFAASEWNGPSAAQDAAMHELQRASEGVLQLATQTHAAVGRNDPAAAEMARASLEQQLTLTTRLIDELLFGGPDQPTTH
ncbi:hypothetical protein [Paraburkholderia ginsengisoli]|uniref:DUF3077 domain-containing protein n=1 Tax=Paraburkholderia ginsengisoli TaxID=311231 RepID=A0A7T4N6C6_9BURK|nr:hypothetical protein [Paraburkholderia ginsengisoli]QQC66038.1 hypothetical protein I6I06_24970 [Paraburkholderia ginsengisoli]